MKKRVISAAIALAIFIPIIIFGGNLFKFSLVILGVLGLKELINIRETKKNFPVIIKILSYLLVIFVAFNNAYNKEMILSINYISIALPFLLLLLPVVFINDNEKYNVTDALFLIGGILFIGIAFNIFMLIRGYDIKYFIFLFLITIATDTYAYLSGILSGRHKLCPDISPKKTIEGLIFGSIFGTIIASTYYYMNISDSVNILYLISIVLLLTLLGQLGDLFFSSIKRYYNRKDYSNIMPGHGGILDRLDSVIFVAYGFIFFISIL